MLRKNSKEAEYSGVRMEFVPLCIAQGGEGLIIADISWAQGSNLQNEQNKPFISLFLISFKADTVSIEYVFKSTMTVRLLPPSADCNNFVRTESL